MVRRHVHWTNGEEEDSQKDWGKKTQGKRYKQEENRAAPHQQSTLHILTLVNIAMTNSVSWNSCLIMIHRL